MCSYTGYGILIVDDNNDDLEALNNILKDKYTVYFAKSGASALKRAAQNKPDLILLDIVMPDMSGFEVLSELRRQEASKSIPVIFITGLNGVEDEEKGFRLGAVDYITKPFHSAIVLARIKSHLKTASQIRDRDGASLVLKTKQEARSILFRALKYVDISGHSLSFNLSDGERVSVYASLKDYESVLLADKRFARCHKSFIVNMDFVDVVEVRDVVLRGGVRLSISKKYSDFKKRYLEWIKG